VDASSFGCVVILSLMNFVISSLIVGTFKSACMTLSDIYHGAFTIARRNIFRNICNILVFELLAVPQREVYLMSRVLLRIYFCLIILHFSFIVSC
jgi:hypothetical protein